VGNFPWAHDCVALLHGAVSRGILKYRAARLRLVACRTVKTPTGNRKQPRHERKTNTKDHIMNLVYTTVAALALTATTAFAAGVEGPAVSADSYVGQGTIGEVVAVISTKSNSTRSGQETIDGKLQLNVFKSSDTIVTAPGGAHFR